jgi:serine O-acetyltransferase
MFTTFKLDAARWIVPGQIGDARALTFARVCKLLFRHVALRALMWFRFASWCKRNKIPYLPGAIQRGLLRNYGFEIMSGADIGGGLYVAHPVGTVIMVNRMGTNCSVIAAATIGMRNEWKFPDIGDQVFIGAGARVLGDLRVGNRAIIGANAVVIDDVPDDATVVGIPAKVIKVNGKPVH